MDSRDCWRPADDNVETVKSVDGASHQLLTEPFVPDVAGYSEADPFFGLDQRDHLLRIRLFARKIATSAPSRAKAIAAARLKSPPVIKTCVQRVGRSPL